MGGVCNNRRDSMMEEGRWWRRDAGRSIHVAMTIIRKRCRVKLISERLSGS